MKINRVSGTGSRLKNIWLSGRVTGNWKISGRVSVRTSYPIKDPTMRLVYRSPDWRKFQHNTK